MTEPPSCAELVRRIEDVVRSVERLTSTMEASYVRKEVYDARHESLRNELRGAVKDVADDVREINRVREKDAYRWKQLMFSVGLLVIGLVITGAFAVSNFMARVGG